MPRATTTAALIALARAALAVNRPNLFQKLMRCMPADRRLEVAYACLVWPAPRLRSRTRAVVPVMRTAVPTGSFRGRVRYTAGVTQKHLRRCVHFDEVDLSDISVTQVVRRVTLAKRFILRGWHWEQLRQPRVSRGMLKWRPPFTDLPHLPAQARVTVWRRTTPAPGPRYASRYFGQPWVAPVPPAAAAAASGAALTCTACAQETESERALASEVAAAAGVARAAPVRTITQCALRGAESNNVDAVFFVESGQMHCQEVADGTLNMPPSLRRPHVCEPTGLLPCIHEIEVEVALLRTSSWSE